MPTSPTEPSNSPDSTPQGGPSEAVEDLLQRALDLAEDGEWGQVAELLNAGLTELGDDPYLFCWLGMAERELGLDGMAYDRFKACLALEPQDPVLLATAGTALAVFDDPEAEAALRTAALIAPELPQARWMYGAYLSREGFAAESLVQLEAAVKLSPEDPVVQIELGVAHALAGSLDQAALAFARAVEMDPEDGWADVLLGLASVQLDEMEEAVRALEEGARIRLDDLEAQLLAALALSATGWDDRALEMLERARLRAEDLDRVLVEEVEGKIEEGSRASMRFLRMTLGPTSFRERLMHRP